MSHEPADPRLSDDEVDARFAGLVADWEPDPEPPRSEQPPTLERPLTVSIPVWRGANGPSMGEILEAEEEDGFVPPPVTLPPGEDLHYWGALAGLVLGPLVLLWVLLADPFYRPWWILGGIALFVGGFVLVVLRSPKRRDPEDDDSGAQV